MSGRAVSMGVALSLGTGLVLAGCAATRADTAAAVVPAATLPTEAAETAVWPVEAFRAQAPAPGEAHPLIVTPPERFTLPNGVEVYLVERHELPLVSLSITFDTGTVADGKKPGVASICFDLLDEGTVALDKVAMEEREADLASQVASFGGVEQSGIRLAALKSTFEPTLDLMMDVILKPGLRKGDFDRLVDQRKAGLLQARASAPSVAARLWNSVLYGVDHPFGKITTEKSLQAVTLDDCKRLAKGLGAKGARLFIAGDLTRKEVETIVGAKFASWKGQAPKSKAIPKAKARSGKVFFVHVPAAEQSAIRLGHLGPDRTAADYEANFLMGSILGGGFTSRINMNIREDKGYSYGARGQFDYHRTGGEFTAASSVKTDTTVPAVREILKEIQLIRDADVRPEELARERDGEVQSLPSSFATGSAAVSTFATLAFFGLPLDYHVGYQERLARVDQTAIRASARTHLDPTSMKVLVVGDKAVVWNDLVQLAAELDPSSKKPVELDADGNTVP